MGYYKPTNFAVLGEILQNKHIFVYGDPDTDGIVATYLVIEQLQARGIKYTYYINNNREHGFKLSDEVLAQIRGCAIIAVDFQMTKEEIQHVVDNGISIIVMDHHELENANENIVCVNSTYGTKGVVVCNQYVFEPEEWRFLSGAGVVFNTFAALDSAYETEKRKALVGVTLLSDSCEIENNNAQMYLDAVYQWRDTESARLIRAVQTEKQRRSMFGVQKYLDREFLDFTFNPTFNALCRFNKQYVALNILLNNGVETDVGYYKGKQAEIRDYLYTNCHLVDLGSLIVCSIDVQNLERSDIEYANFIGLLANYILNDRKKSVVIYITNGTEFIRGSVRGFCGSVNYLALFKQQRVMCDGHACAFGLLEIPTNEQLYVLNAEVDTQERIVQANGTTTYKYIPIYNLKQTLTVDKQTVRYNQYVRDKYRAYYVYLGSNWEITKQNEAGTYVLYDIDGVAVKCFDKNITPENGVILPMFSNGYTVCTLNAKNL